MTLKARTRVSKDLPSVFLARVASNPHSLWLELDLGSAANKMANKKEKAFTFLAALCTSHNDWHVPQALLRMI